MSNQKEPVTCANDLEASLQRAYDQAIRLRFRGADLNILEALKSPDIGVSLSAFEAMHKLDEGLQDIVVHDKRFIGDHARMISHGQGASGLYPSFVASPLIRKTLETGSPGAAIRWLEKVLGTTSATGKLVQLLWGIPVLAEIELSKGIKIIPFSAIPDSEHKRAVLEGPQLRPGSLPMSMLDLLPPPSALSIDLDVKPVITEPGQHQDVKDGFSKAAELMKEISLVLTIIGPRAPISASMWFTFDDPDLEYARMGSSYAFEMQEVVPVTSQQWPLLDADEAKQITQAFVELLEITRAPVRVALQRVNQAQRRQKTGDRAVELAIALESLLGDNNSNEMLHKITTRAVRIVGGPVETRKFHAAIIKHSYSIRSKLVHTGEADPVKPIAIMGEKTPPSKVIDEMLIICIKLIKIIILRKSIPDWGIFDITEQCVETHETNFGNE